MRTPSPASLPCRPRPCRQSCIVATRHHLSHWQDLTWSPNLNHGPSSGQCLSQGPRPYLHPNPELTRNHSLPCQDLRALLWVLCYSRPGVETNPQHPLALHQLLGCHVCLTKLRVVQAGLDGQHRFRRSEQTCLCLQSFESMREALL
jgi:hypothetical protein